MEYQDFRNTYTTFYYHDFEISEDEQEIRVMFDFEIGGLSHFDPVFILPKPKDGRQVTQLKAFREAAFSLGMVELISYWKITCPGQVIVECGYLEEEQIRWWKKLYYYGLEEFFSRNHITETMESFMALSAVGEKITGEEDTCTYAGNLIPVGGGKDSFVSLDLLKAMRSTNKVFIINSIRSALNSAEAAGYSGADMIVASRSLDPRMLECNKEGYLNGNTPFSALTAFSALLTAIVYRTKYICLSNGDISGDTGPWYGKTYAFEQDLDLYIRTWLSGNIRCFSLLRPLRDLQITGIFAGLPKYHRVFRSCTAGEKEGIWCGHCIRCLLAAVMLSAYLDNEEITEIFGRDILDDEELLEMFAQLTGMRDEKPEECTGTREEVNMAVNMYLQRTENTGKEIPYLFRAYQTTKYYMFYRNRQADLHRYNTENQLPEEYAEIVRERIGEL